MIHQSTKSPNFLKELRSDEKTFIFNNWAYSERNGYKVTSTFNIEQQKVKIN